MGGKGASEGRKGKLTGEEVGLPTTIPPYDNVVTRSEGPRKSEVSLCWLSELEKGRLSSREGFYGCLISIRLESLDRESLKFVRPIQGNTVSSRCV